MRAKTNMEKSGLWHRLKTRGVLGWNARTWTSNLWNKGSEVTATESWDVTSTGSNTGFFSLSLSALPIDGYVKSEHFSDRYICTWIFLLYTEYSEEFSSTGQPKKRLKIHKIASMVGFVEDEVYLQMVLVTWGAVSSSLHLVSLRNFFKRNSAVWHSRWL